MNSERLPCPDTGVKWPPRSPVMAATKQVCMRRGWKRAWMHRRLGKGNAAPVFHRYAQRNRAEQTTATLRDYLFSEPLGASTSAAPPSKHKEHDQHTLLDISCLAA